MPPIRPRRKRLIGSVAVLAAVVLVKAHTAGAAPDRLPDSIAAIGDSISQAANPDLLHIGLSNPAHSWSTGNHPMDAIDSHYERILARNGEVAGRNFNQSVSGARMKDAPAQAEAVARQGAEYVTVLMGGNDVCASSKEAMTPMADYESAFRQTMDVLTTGLSAAPIYVVSVPDVYRLWNVHRLNPVAVTAWDWFKICQSMLARSNTEADRQLVRNRNIDYNRVLRRVCADYVQCRYDDDRVFDYRFSAVDVSTVDYFHPSAVGQRNLAEITWRAGYWPDL